MNHQEPRPRCASNLILRILLAAGTRLALLALMALGFGGAAVDLHAQSSPYRTITGWGEVPEGMDQWGQVNGVQPDREGNLWVFHRCGSSACAGIDDIPPIVKLDPQGKLLKAFGEGLFVRPHGLFLDHEGNIWTTDQYAEEGRGNQVIKFSPDGEVLMTLGTAGVVGEGPYVFTGPSAVAVAASTGDIFVADGHGNGGVDRVVKYSKDGEFLMTWGRNGYGPGEFRDPHDIAVDSRGRVFVADRGNNRIQIFDLEGNFLAQWTQFGMPSGLYIDEDDVLYVSDAFSSLERNAGYEKGIRIGSVRDGWVRYFIPAGDHGGEYVAADRMGNVYSAVVGGQDVVRYVPIPDEYVNVRDMVGSPPCCH